MIQRATHLPDRRMLHYNLYGPPGGKAVLYFHGTPSSRLEPLMPTIYGVDIIDLLHRYDLQLIAVDRPGMGFSSFDDEGTFVSFADDVSVLLQQIDVKQCPVLCWSGGGPYALAMTHQYPDVITSTFIIAGFTLSLSSLGLYAEMKRNKFYFKSAQQTPILLEKVLNYLAKKDIKKTFWQSLAGMSDVDYSYFKDPRHLKQVAAITIQEACRYGSLGAVREAANYFNDFGFDLSSIKRPVHYWWGSEDMEVIGRHPGAIEKYVPHHKIYFKKGDGHVSVYVRYIEEILSAIASNIV